MAHPAIKIMRVGDFTDVNGRKVSFGLRELDGMVKSYSQALRPAPIVVGHPDTDKPVYGWIDGLRLDGNFVTAQPSEVAASFAEQVRAGRYRKISASFYPPSNRDNPAPGYWYLKHVGFLGAQAPAVRGLGTVAFAETVPIEFDPAEIAPVVSFAAPDGFGVAGEALYHRAVVIQSENPGMSIVAAAMLAKRRQ